MVGLRTCIGDARAANLDRFCGGDAPDGGGVWGRSNRHARKSRGPLLGSLRRFGKNDLNARFDPGGPIGILLFEFQRCTLAFVEATRVVDEVTA